MDTDLLGRCYANQGEDDGDSNGESPLGKILKVERDRCGVSGEGERNRG